MLAGISHDIRTPLTSISGYIEMLEHADAGEQQRYLHIITARLRDMEELLDTFFVYARLQASEEEIECRRQPIYPLLCESVLSYYAQLQEKGIAPQMICADEQVQGVVEEASLNTRSSVPHRQCDPLWSGSVYHSAVSAGRSAAMHLFQCLHRIVRCPRDLSAFL